MNDLLSRFGKGLTSVTAPTNDHTVPRRAKWFGYPLIGLMAWRTSRILLRAVPQDLFGYLFAVVGLFATEIGSLFWFGLLTECAHEEKGNDQKGIAAAMFVGDFILSVITTIADITDTTGVTTIAQTQWAMPVALIGSGVWAIANVGAWLWYTNASPVAKANRQAKAREFALQIKQRETSDDIAHLAEEVRLREEHIAAQERLLGRAESVEERAKRIGLRLNAWRASELVGMPVSGNGRKEEKTFQSEVETVPNEPRQPR